MNNIKINKTNKSVLITLNNSIYNPDKIDQAIKDYAGISSISKLSRDQINIIPIDINDLDKIGFEFCNYLIGLNVKY